MNDKLIIKIDRDLEFEEGFTTIKRNNIFIKVNKECEDALLIKDGDYIDTTELYYKLAEYYLNLINDYC